MNYDELHTASSTKFSNNEKVLIQRTAQAIYYQSSLILIHSALIAKGTKNRLH